MAYTQDDRIIALTDTPLAKDLLLLQGFSGQEGISRLFRFEAEALSEDSGIAFEKIVGQRVTIRMQLAEGKNRYINGFVSRFTQHGQDERFTHYRLEIVPWLWFLTRTADCRIFQNMTVPDIVQKIFKDLGFTDFRLALEGSFEPREYCVQYRETDFNFVSRLMEQYGISYFFEHEQKKHTLVLANAPSGHPPCPQQAMARCAFGYGAVESEDVVNDCHVEQELRPGKYALTDFNFETPSSSLMTNVSSTVSVGGNSKYEIYDYPGEYTKKAQGDQLAELRIEEEESTHFVLAGESTCRAFAAGHRVALTEHYRADLNKTYLLLDVQHSATVGEAYVSGGGESRGVYSNHFSCVPHANQHRPPRVTPRPLVGGPQTAIVVGKSGEEIWTEQYGRVKVQFHWDREGKRDENSSCWIRVSHPWAGKGWGAIAIPRIGQEVVVDFLEGDPDQPLITGRVYNAEQMPPYTLPDEQTKSTTKSRSSKGGAEANWNEIRFEDKKGGEQIFINAERDLDLRVENDGREWIGKDDHLVVKGNRKEMVEADAHIQIKGASVTKVGGALSLQVGDKDHRKIGTVYSLESGQEIHLKGGMKVIIEAGMQLSLVGPGGFVDIGPAGVTIQGTLVQINSGGSAGQGTAAQPDSPEDPDVADDGTKTGKLS